MPAIVAMRSTRCWRCSSQWIWPPRSRQLSNGSRFGQLEPFSSSASNAVDPPLPLDTRYKPDAPEKSGSGRVKPSAKALFLEEHNPLLDLPVPTNLVRSPPSSAPRKRGRPKRDPALLKAKSNLSLKRSLEPQYQHLPSPPPSQAQLSAKLNSLHARLQLPKDKFPVNTLARCLIDASADPNPACNNASLAVLGEAILRYHATEYLISKYPRLPMEVTFSATWAFISPLALSLIVRELGIELAAAPGGEVDPGLLQFDSHAMDHPSTTSKDVFEGDPLVPSSPSPGEIGGELKASRLKRQTLSQRTVKGDVFGEMTVKQLTCAWDDQPMSPQISSQAVASAPKLSGREAIAQHNLRQPPSPPQRALATFARALFGALHIHLGPSAARTFFRAHVLSRHLDVSSLFYHRFPTRDLSRLCAREGFKSPVARILSETGRGSRSPVFGVGIFSGMDKLGEGSGSSLDEARIRAAAAAMRGWYLYSPFEGDGEGAGRVPSDAEHGEGGQARDGGDGAKAGEFRPIFVDCGEVFY